MNNENTPEPDEREQIILTLEMTVGLLTALRTDGPEFAVDYVRGLVSEMSWQEALDLAGRAIGTLAGIIDRLDRASDENTELLNRTITDIAREVEHFRADDRGQL